MAKIVLTCDDTLTSTYRNLPFLDMLACAPTERFPGFIYRVLDSQLPHSDGVLEVAPYSLRKLEASVVDAGLRDVIVVHSGHVRKHIDGSTTVVAVSTMDPLGLGPVSMMFTNCGRSTAYSKQRFLGLIDNLVRIRRSMGAGFKIVVGGSGSWQLAMSEKWREMGIDHLFVGEADHVAGELFKSVEDGAEDLSPLKGSASVDQIAAIIGPAYKGLAEVSRGCGRNCKYCDPSLRKIRAIPDAIVHREVEVNAAAGLTNAWLQSDDIFLYRLEDRRDFTPNSPEIVGLFEGIMGRPGVTFANPTHGSISPAAADPAMIGAISEVVRASPSRWVGIQAGLETGSSSLMEKHMENKAKPFSCGEWPEIVVEGTYILNSYYWFPAYTVMLGLPGETAEDALDTARLIITMEKFLKDNLASRSHFTITPVAFVPLGLMRDGTPFDIREQLTEERFLVLYYSWRHLLKELASFAPSVGSSGNRGMAAFYLPGRLGLWTIMSLIRRWGMRMGYDPDRRLDPLDVNLRVPALPEMGPQIRSAIRSRG
mgnify:CR=1 FL=1